MCADRRSRDFRARNVLADDRNHRCEHVIELVWSARPVKRAVVVGLVPHLPVLDVVLDAVTGGRAMLYQRSDEGGKRGTATGSKVAGRTRRKIVPKAPTFAVASSSGDPTGDEAKGVDDRTWLLLGDQVQPLVQVAPVVIAASASVQEGPFGTRLPQAHCPRLRLGRDPRAIPTIEALKTPICRCYGKTTHGQNRAARRRSIGLLLRGCTDALTA